MNTSDPRPTALVYVDGFNLYRQLLEHNPQLKWLDLEALAARVLPDYRVIGVEYFTARIKPLPGKDPSAPQRQQIYLRALATRPSTTTFLGKFRIDTRVMPMHPTAFDADGKVIRVRVKKAEEKGSDVALASRLLIDAMNRRADIYAVCTNDSDRVMPLELVQQELGGAIGLLSTVPIKRASNQLKQTRPQWHRHITRADVAASQLQDEVRDATGVIRRPAKWSTDSEGPA